MVNLLLPVICLYVNWAASAFVHDIDTIVKNEAINSHVHAISVLQCAWRLQTSPFVMP